MKAVKIHLHNHKFSSILIVFEEYIIVRTRGPVMSPGAIGARQRVPTIETLRALSTVSIVMFHNSML